MSSFYINGGNKLNGELELYSAKNALLPILAGVIISNQEVIIKNCCKFSDVLYMVKILEKLGAKAEFIDDDLRLDLSEVHSYELPEEYTKKVRSSIFMLGSLLSRFRKAKVSYPGGCNIGTRPIDLHLKGLKELGVEIVEEDGFIICDGQNMKSGVVEFPFPSVGATENVMMASVLLKGETTILNPAKEPEIVDLQNFLNSMGANISGAGTGKIKIVGVESLTGTTYKPISDRIVTGTYLIACAMIGGKITLTNTYPEHNVDLIKYLKQCGCKIKVSNNSITIERKGKLKSIKRVDTKPYPGFPTDLQSPFLAMQTLATGETQIVENLYETRFKIVPELIKMGAQVSIKDRSAFVKGVKELEGAKVIAHDLRTGAGLIIAGLSAKGTTIVTEIENIERGYLHIDQDFKKLNADIRRVDDEN